MEAADTTGELTIGRRDMPALFQSTDAAAIRAQRSFFRLVKAQIFALLTATTSSVVDAAVAGHVWLAYTSIGALVALAIFRVYQRYAGFEALWYEGRAGAESLKTLTWRYAMCVDPFGPDASSREADRLFLERVHESLGELSSVLFIPRRHTGDQITTMMRRLRLAPFEDRRAVYMRDRVEDQADWYVRRARQSAIRSRGWDIAFLASCGLAVIFGLLRVAGALEVNLLSVAGMVAAVIGTWVGVRRYGSTARAYSIAAHELIAIRSELPLIEQDEWSDFITSAEEAISREHTLWRASRT